ncbi:MAG: hypothetical protein OHK0021_12730 [Bryobacter sp.]
MKRERLKHFLWVLFPVLLALFLYRGTFRIWFLKDDFAWLGLRLSVNSLGDLFAALFTPMAQGTVRFLSERLFFLSFESVFGLESLPMRIWMFLTLAVAMGLLVKVGERLSGRVWVGSLAAVFWSLNFGVSVAMCWLASYNQILVSALLLGSLYALMRGNAVAMWACLVAGFGALENMVVAPGVLLLYALLYDRSKVRTVLPTFAASALFLFLHFAVIPKPERDPSYQMHFDASMLETLGIYWQWLLGAVKLSSFSPDYLWLPWPTLLGGTALLVGALALGAWRRDALPFFGLALSLAMIAPMLPLRDHRTDYYLASASIGICLTFASAVPLTPIALRWLLGLGLVAYLYPSYLVQARTFEWYLNTTGPVRTIVRGAMHASSLHQDKLILLDGIDAGLYGNTIADDGLRLIAAGRLRLAPGNGPPASPWVLSPEATRAALEKNQARIYRLEGAKLRDITRQWEQTKGPELAGGFAPAVIAGESTFDSQFLSGFYAAAEGSRWMAKRGVVRLGGGPYSEQTQLHIQAYVPAALGPVEVEVLCGGTTAGTFRVNPGEWIAQVPLPASVRAEGALEIELRASKSIRPPEDGRELSLLLLGMGLR